MVISNISLTKDEQFVTLSADIAFRNKTPQRAYFKVLRNYETFVTNDATPFLAAFLASCMNTRENIYIDDTVSAQLLEKTNEIMSQLKKINKNLYKIRIRSKRTAQTTFKSKNQGVFFEADVNTFYTYLKQQKNIYSSYSDLQKQNNESYTRTKYNNRSITHLISVHGFTDYSQKKEYALAKENLVKKIAKEEKIEAILVETNIGVLIDEHVQWNFVYPGALESVAFFLNHDFKKIFVSEMNDTNQFFVTKTHVLFGTLWSTESLTVHHGEEKFDYREKIKLIISKSPLALKYLSVCTQNAKTIDNCGQCYQCLITMFYLRGAKVLKKTKTFANTIDKEKVKKMHISYKKKEHIEVKKALEMFKKNNINPELQEAIIYSLEKNKKYGVIKGFYPKLTGFFKNNSFNSRKPMPRNHTNHIQDSKLVN